jgi:hypothetical protein
MTISVSPRSSQRDARRVRLMAEVLLPVFLAAIVLPLIGSVFLAVTDAAMRPAGARTSAAVAMLLVSAAPALCLAMTIAALRGLFFEYEHGRFLGAVASTHFRRAGSWSLAACGLKFVFAPLCAMALLRTPLDQAFRFTMFDVGIVVVATFVLMIGHVLENVASGLKAENDEIV